MNIQEALTLAKTQGKIVAIDNGVDPVLPGQVYYIPQFQASQDLAAAFPGPVNIRFFFFEAGFYQVQPFALPGDSGFTLKRFTPTEEELLSTDWVDVTNS
nr:MAG: hypothetical protein [Bacteriophage sp.]